MTEKRLGKYRLKCDWELPLWKWMSRALWKLYKKLPFPPATLRFYGGKSTVRLSSAAIAFLGRINSPAAMKFLNVKDGGWRNKGDSWHVEQLGFEGNLVDVIKIKGNKAYIRTLFNNKMPTQANYDACVMHQFHCVTRQNTLVRPDCGLCLILVIANPGEELWIPLDELGYVGA